jgi:hypothetical protein
VFVKELKLIKNKLTFNYLLMARAKKDDKQVTVYQEGQETLEGLFNQAEFLINKKMVPATIKRPQDVVNIIQIGETLGMNPSTALNSIDMIQGNAAIKAKIIPGLLAKNGIAVKVIKDYEPIIEQKKIPMKDKDGKYMKDSEGNFKFYTNPDGSLMYKDEIIDRITTVQFKRHFPHIGIVDNEIEFRWSDAVDAGWDSKPNWKKMPRYMMMARCMTRGARIVASELSLVTLLAAYMIIMK